ncbi:MAG: ZIP family metal transporter [Cyclobacteriaceae bacterium]|nr:ZIP family metal transporter [Cyclobacteriaceae bacterium]
MTLKLLVLFFVPLLAGMLVFIVPTGKLRSYRLMLVFAGSYLFGLTVVHILPELYRTSSELELTGLFVLAGFFLQQLLEYITSGIEHGHLPSVHDHAHHHNHQHRQISALVLLLALCVHAFLEGAMLAQPATMGFGYDVHAILLGIALHRAPAAFALITVLVHQLHGKARTLPYLFVFSFAAPAGLLLASYLAHQELLTASGLTWLYALVSGNFLHISTTIVFESSPEHHFNARKLAVAVLGALLAVGVEYMM